MKDNDSKLIWESYFTRGEGIEDDFAKFADENPAPQETKLPHMNYRDWVDIWKAPDSYSDIDDVKQYFNKIPPKLQPFFKPDQEGSFLVIAARDEFHDHAQSIDGDGMGGIIEYKLGGFLIGMEDGNYVSYIKREIHAKNNLKLKRPPREQ